MRGRGRMSTIDDVEDAVGTEKRAENILETRLVNPTYVVCTRRIHSYAARSKSKRFSHALETRRARGGDGETARRRPMCSAYQSIESKSRYIDSETSPEGVYSPFIASLIRSSTRRSGPTPTRASCSTRLAGLPVTPRAIDAVTNGKDSARRNASAVRPMVSSPTSSVDVSAARAARPEDMGKYLLDSERRAYECVRRVHIA